MDLLKHLTCQNHVQIAYACVNPYSESHIELSNFLNCITFNRLLIFKY